MKTKKVTQSICVYAKELTDAGFHNSYIVSELGVGETTLRTIRRSGYNVKTYHQIIAERNFQRRLKANASKMVPFAQYQDKVNELTDIIGNMQAEKKNDLLALHASSSRKIRKANAWVSTYRLLFFFAAGIIVARILVDQLAK